MGSPNPYHPFPSTSHTIAVFPVDCNELGESPSIPRPYIWCRQPDEVGVAYPCVVSICCVPAVQTEWPVCEEPIFVPEPGLILGLLLGIVTLGFLKRVK